MPSAADVVLLSSTPDHKPTRTPQRVSHHSETQTGLSLQFDSPASLPSPSELFRQLHRPADVTPQDTEKDAARKTTGKRAADKSTSDAKATENKPKRGGRKITDELQTVLTHAEPAAPRFKDNAPKKAPKTRTKRTNTNTEKKREGPKNKTLTGRVSKASSADSQQSDTKKPSSSKSSSQGGATKDLDGWEASGLQLEEATIRRLDWTPTKDTGKQVFDLEGDGDAGDSQASGAAQNFSNLLAGYGFTGTASSQPSIQGNEDGGGPTKRRRIDLMDSRIQAGPKSNTKDKIPVDKESQQKPKKQNKKFTTLTARVTARYAPGYTEDSGNGSLYTADVQEHEAAGRKRKSKTKTKPREPEFIVLSPEAAVKSLDNQDLMFGTCSQLEREDSPTTLRDMQTAINESESCIEPMPKFGTSRTSSASTVSRFTGPRSLWSEAFRDLDGALAQAEVLDLVDDCDLSKISPRVDRERHDAQQQETPKVVDQPVNTTHEKEASIPEGNSDALENSSQFADANASQQSEAASVAVESRPQMPRYNAFTEAELSKQVASYGFKAVRGRQKMIDLLQKCWESKHGTSATSNGDKQGSLDGSALTKPPETSKDGKTTNTSNKTSGSRPRSKAKSTANPLIADDTSAKPPARRRQGSSRPASRSSQKATESLPSQQQRNPPTQQKPSYANVEEIQDSEDEAIPSPNQLLSRYFTHPKPSNQPLAVSPTPSPTRHAPSKPKTLPKATTTISRTPEDDEPDLAIQITKAVRAQPNMYSSAGGRRSPSWHEKILMYDPIVLEDFTTWLNIEGLGLVSEDREVDAVLVREWCESKGICCCYRNKSW
ncbi:protein slx4 [Aspergillus glaucus CBS 516.65]|uniref:Structure-specific endonuclease subunit SLX4 n=1 Tax=Aspergillus glaucus CBS 516.65 TaxID=1160497 RepID=A0A1L9VSM7_ASPGL|nr:hypothetical protein ASPGLDRAFT_143318 [Aspergillus glaucus CBS 516.65]OJJ86921.1 hypothetical protein ASPGLDRAFT_143318 [Aspergillus glaucus CBS 516.65]